MTAAASLPVKRKVQPAYLQMWLGGQMIEQVEMKYGYRSTTGKKHYQEKIANELFEKYTQAIIKSRLWPVFFVVQQSKMQ